jgi:hypothetical protein
MEGLEKYGYISFLMSAQMPDDYVSWEAQISIFADQTHWGP